MKKVPKVDTMILRRANHNEYHNQVAHFLQLLLKLNVIKYGGKSGMRLMSGQKS